MSKLEWLKEILSGKGIENVEEIMADVSKELPKHFVPNETYNGKVEEAKRLQGIIDKAPNSDELQKKYDELQAKYDTDTQKLNDDLIGKDRNYAIEIALSKTGAKSSKALRALLDESKIEYKDGNLSGLDEQIESVKKEHGYLFGTDKNTSFSLGGGGSEEDSFTAAMKKGAGLE
ncbi:MAG: phage scaffolding protein [Clostridia bacterium]|nr:phage scaffolding protein [Clostridia bacterium]